MENQLIPTQKDDEAPRTTFRGGVWIGMGNFGYWLSSWPFGVLQIGPDSLNLRDTLRRKTFKFSKQEILKIETKKFFPTIELPTFGYWILIRHTNEAYHKKIYFSQNFRFRELVNTLKKFGWM